VRTGGWGKHNIFFLGGAFRKAKYEIRRRRKKIGIGKRGRAKIPSPPTPFLFARPSDWILKFGVRIFVKKCSNFVQKTPPKQISGRLPEWLKGTVC
jgi:hypothetical protein